jgi:ribosomal protein L11 methyltransferase
LFSLLLHPSPAQEDFLTADLWELGAAGISEEDEGIRAFFEASADARRLIDRLAGFRPELRQEADVDWARATRDAWPPLIVGERFYLVAPWSEQAAPPGRVRLEIEPGMACGTGRHPATQLCLEAMERFVRPRSRVVDIGTGSGILARAATLLGVAGVIACDIDPDAVEIARRTPLVAVFTGSADALRGNSADLIVANIDSAALEQLRDDLARVRKPDSVMILSGFPEDELPRGFPSREVLRKDGWACVIC